MSVKRGRFNGLPDMIHVCVYICTLMCDSFMVCVCVSTECWSAKVFLSLTANVIRTLLCPYSALQGKISHMIRCHFTVLNFVYHTFDF